MAAAIKRQAEFRGDNRIGATRPKRAAQYFLGGARAIHRIDVSRIEEINARIERGMNDLSRSLLIETAAEIITADTQR